MVKYTLRILVLVLFVTYPVSESYAQKKRAQTSMKFLSVSPLASAAAMSSAVTSVEMGAASAFYNPAGASRFENTFDFTGGAVQWIDDISYQSGSILYKFKNENLGVFGFNFLSVDYGDILSTVIDFGEPAGYRDVGTINPTAIAIGFLYANAITDQFSVGANFRYAIQDLASTIIDTDGTGGYVSEDFSASTGVLDFGVLYKTGFESLNFAMSLRNFSPEVKYDVEESELPLTFNIGLSMNVLDLTNLDPETHSMVVSIDARRPRDFEEQLILGVDYSFLNRFNIRGGYGIPTEEETFSLGAGIRQPIGKLALKADYSYTEFGVFGGINRISFQIDF